jgi:hypothetical protein
MHWSKWLVLASFLLIIGTGAVARAAEPLAANGEQYIKVEIKGVLKTGVVAIGGETTGITITAGKVTWELEIKGQTLLALAQQLDGKTVLVKGELHVTSGVEIPVRSILTVTELKAG